MRVSLLIIFVTLAWADGGTVLFHKTAGDFDLTVFGKSEAVRAGVNDFSVMVQRGDHVTVMNANVVLHLSQTQSTGDILRLTSIASHAKASNKMLYGANVNIPSTGTWRVDVDVSSDGRNGTASSEVPVLAPLPPVVNYWPYVAMVPALGIAFLINRKLRERFRPKTGA